MHTIQCTPLDRLIIDKLGFAKDESANVRAQVKSGEKHQIKRLFAVEGTVTIGDDYNTTPTVHIPLKATLAILLQRMGFQRDLALRIIREAVTDALLNQEKANKTLPVIEEMLEKLEGDLIQQLPKVKRKGAVTLDVTVMRVEVDNVKPYSFVELVGGNRLGKTAKGEFTVKSGKTAKRKRI